MSRNIFLIASFLLLWPALAATLLAAPGDLDPGFGGDGIVSTQIPNASLAAASDIVIQPDGKVVVSVLAQGQSKFDLAIVRYNIDGTLDATFSGDGIFTTPFGGSDLDTATGLALQPDGKILVAGTLLSGKTAGFLVLRINTDGSLDTTFDNDGIVVNPVFIVASGRSIAVQADGKIVVGGDAFVGSDDYFAVVRLNSNGSVDTGFGSNGAAIVSFGPIDFFNDMVLQPDGKIVVLGDGDVASGNAYVAMARFTSNGILDETFDGDGKVTTQIAGLGGRSLAWQSDGKVLVSGFLFGDFAVIRYTSNGALDNSFDGDGIATAGFGDMSDAAHNLVVQPDNRIVAVGEVAAGAGFTDLDIAVARFDPNGSLDTTFGTNGRVVTRVAGGSDLANAVALQPDGKIVAAGAGTELGSSQVTLVRYLNSTALNVSVSGRITNASGRGIFNARIAMTEPGGNIRYAASNPFGYYRFANVETGHTYVLSVSSKRHTFDPPSRSVLVNDHVTNFDFISDN